MKRYFKNVCLALMGINPFRQELDEKTSQYEKTADNLSALQKQYYTALENWDKAEKDASALQQLVENLRTRKKEKDAELEAAGHEFRDRMERMKADYQKRIDEYNQKIEELQERLKQKS